MIAIFRPPWKIPTLFWCPPNATPGAQILSTNPPFCQSRHPISTPSASTRPSEAALSPRCREAVGHRPGRGAALAPDCRRSRALAAPLLLEPGLPDPAEERIDERPHVLIARELALGRRHLLEGVVCGVDGADAREALQSDAVLAHRSFKEIAPAVRSAPDQCNAVVSSFGGPRSRMS